MAMRLGRFLGLAALVVLAASAFTPLLAAVAAWLGGTARLDPADAIVVAARGGVDSDGVLSNASLRRALHGIALYRRGLAPLLLFTGGHPDRRPDEAAARADLARCLGVPAPAILADSRAHTTREEARAVRAVLAPRGVRRILLVADPSDMPRTRALFAQAGFDVLPAPTDADRPGTPEARLGLLRELLSEGLAWAYYRLAGYL
jgi:uncharacterized SAM-binding protein YcdF (DUF218 family)